MAGRLAEKACVINTVLVFAILVGLGVAATGWALLGHRGSQVHP